MSGIQSCAILKNIEFKSSGLEILMQRPSWTGRLMGGSWTQTTKQNERICRKGTNERHV
jgi:hypothetical protein